ncbi:recombinase family protein [Mycobacteroides abscessus]|uniref:recombinase family protein n=1 Tax=Mycobacteroides abscessus TaxID=36809 RepID=UPI001F407199|nr:recombinase family protein [Mycobacteroides abscessus]
MDVSAGKTTPFDRPQLGDWLTNRHHEFDVLVVFRMDRIVRRLLDLADLIRWCQTHSVALVSATEGIPGSHHGVRRRGSATGRQGGRDGADCHL